MYVCMHVFMYVCIACNSECVLNFDAVGCFHDKALSAFL